MIAKEIVTSGTSIYLENLIANSATSSSWQSRSGSYGVVSYSYSKPLLAGRKYWAYCKYYYTTTNSSNMTWMAMYCFGGSDSFQAISISPGTESTAYTYSRIKSMGNIPGNYKSKELIENVSGTLYAGDSSKVSGTTSYWKDMMIIDITDLYLCLNTTSDTTVLNWLNSNVTYFTGRKEFSILNFDRLSFKDSKIYTSNIIDSEFLWTCPECYYATSAHNNYSHNDPYLDQGYNGCAIYNNNGNGVVTWSRESAQSDSPFYTKHRYNLKVVTAASSSKVAQPGMGGVYCTNIAYANAVFVEKFVAKLPIGYKFNIAHNSQGTGASVSFIGSNLGTGKWEEYTILYRCGSSGSFSSGGHIYVTSIDSNTYDQYNVTWYLAFIGMFDVTGREQLIYAPILPQARMKNKSVYSSVGFNTGNLLINGDFTNKWENIQSCKSAGWTLDYDDYPSGIESKVSLVQPIGKASCAFDTDIAINPAYKYKLSGWVKNTNAQTNYLCYLYWKLSNGTVMVHYRTQYKNGTMTKLTKAVSPGDTKIYLTSTANWALGSSRSYANIGFRSSSYNICYNDLGTMNNTYGSAGSIQSIESDGITLKSGWTGSSIPLTAYAVECYDGGNYPYPWGRQSSNDWTYVEYTIGGGWDGNDYYGSWAGIPSQCVNLRIGLNLYSATNQPVKYAGWKLICLNAGNRKDNILRIDGDYKKDI